MSLREIVKAAWSLNYLNEMLSDHYTHTKPLTMRQAALLVNRDSPLVKPPPADLLFRGLTNVGKSKLTSRIKQDGKFSRTGIAPGVEPIAETDVSWTTEPAIAVQFACGFVGPDVAERGYSVIYVCRASDLRPVLNAAEVAKTSLGSKHVELWDEKLRNSILNEREVCASQVAVPALVVWAPQGDGRELTQLLSEATNTLRS